MAAERLLLFDWFAGGHHELYLERFAAALGETFDVTIAAADVALDRIGGEGLDYYPLGEQRPVVDTSRYWSSGTRSTARRELTLFRRAVEDTGAAHTIHMFADGVLRWLARTEESRSQLTLLLFRPRLHYRSLYGTHLGPRDTAAAWAFERVLAGWRKRRDAHAILTLDPDAATRWSAGRGAGAHWVPEPPIDASAPVARQERPFDWVLFGSLSPRKGIDLLAEAVAKGAAGKSLLLAGRPDPGYGEQVQALAARMRSAGVNVELRTELLSDSEALETLARAKCAVMPYPRHLGMSRVLVEAATVGTPVVVNDWGLLGHLVRQHDLGLAVDADDPQALNEALMAMTNGADVPGRYLPALSEFAGLFSREVFAERLRAPFGPGGATGR
jgi:glycosyltransferase involved in cell wall biosynthesis